MKILKMAAAAFVLNLALLGCMGFFQKPEPVVETKTITYVVKAGETVWEYAEREFENQNRYRNLQDFVEAIRRNNGLMGRNLQPGDTLDITLESVRK